MAAGHLTERGVLCLMNAQVIKARRAAHSRDAVAVDDPPQGAIGEAFHAALRVLDGTLGCT